nr:2-amino-4-hydroxy-6-hydroxymethyldihydropteridine diphosphokinase [Dehalogenimonas formicexedens]
MTGAVVFGFGFGSNQFHQIFLGLGSNLGDRLENLESALKLISEKVTVTRTSPIYETLPLGVSEQPKFLNLVIEGNTAETPEGLLGFLKSIEQKLGRGDAGSDAPRPIDIDILFFDDLTMSGESLVIPHPRLSQRAFVLVPLNELAPDLVHPVMKKTVNELLAALDNTRGVELYSGSLHGKKA